MRHGGAALRQLGSAAAHCKLDPAVSFLIKQLCSQEIYRCQLFYFCMLDENAARFIGKISASYFLVK
jgi:hypothetical protein